MAFIENLDHRISKFGRDAFGKAKDATESVRISAAIREEQSKQRELFQQIGANYYRLYADQAEGELRGLCESISVSQQQILQYQEQLKILKGVTYCPNCNAEVPMNAMFCNNCGTKLMTQSQPQPQQHEAVPTQRICKNCGNVLNEEQAFCTSCGSKYE